MSQRARRRLLAAAIAALLLATGLAACGSDDGSSSGSSDGDAATATEQADLRAIAVQLLDCLADEGVELPGPGAGPIERLQAVRELDKGDGQVADAVRACFPALAQEFVDAGLRPPTQGDVGVEPTTSPDRPAGAPLYEGDFADPFLLSVDGGYLYATNTLFENVPVTPTPEAGGDLDITDAMPELPAWTQAGAVWAPSVAAVDDGYVLYFTSRDTDSGLQCIGVATADAPTGPFTGADDSLVCPTAYGGAIDASPVTDGDRRYIVFKTDGNCCDLPTTIYVQEVSADGTRLTGEAVELLGAEEGWEGDLVEGPAMAPAPDGSWLLFYSANRWDTADYAVGWAGCESVTGPCTKGEGQPWLASYDRAAGPGGQELVVGADGEAAVVYHGWAPDLVGYESGGSRRLYAEPVELDPPTLPF